MGSPQKLAFLCVVCPGPAQPKGVGSLCRQFETSVNFLTVIPDLTIFRPEIWQRTTDSAPLAGL
jgi:hypothetical protein